VKERVGIDGHHPVVRAIPTRGERTDHIGPSREAIQSYPHTRGNPRGNGGNGGNTLLIGTGGNGVNAGIDPGAMSGTPGTGGAGGQLLGTNGMNGLTCRLARNGLASPVRLGGRPG
jgi:hypothetical protein